MNSAPVLFTPVKLPLAIVLLLVGCARPQPTDVIVVGAGISGLSAALEAARGGATVRLVEMSSVFGGHAVMAHGGLALVATPIQEAQGVGDSPEVAERDFLSWGEDANREWVTRYVASSREMVFDWVRDLGVSFSDRLIQIPGNSVPRFHSPKGRGLGLVSPIYRAAERNPGIEFEWNVRIDELLVEEGRAVGVRGTSLRSGKPKTFRADHVVLATGGFQSNLEMVREFWPEQFEFPGRILVGSGAHSVGSGHRVAQAAGAALQNMDRQWNYATGLPDPRFPGTDRGLNASNGASIWVNTNGERFVNETASTKDRFRALLRQEDARYWALFDERAKPRLFVSGSDWADSETVERLILADSNIVKVANTWSDLAGLTGLPVEALVGTVERYNQMIREGVDQDFRRFGFGTVPYDLAPGSEVGAVEVLQPPFYALSFFPLARKSMGGVAIDERTRVLSPAGEVIPGLYAVGELAGFGGINGWAGLEGTFLGPCILTGRVAGWTLLDAIGRARELQPVKEVEPETSAMPLNGGPADDRDQCFECHALPALVKTDRPGYWHFAEVHKRALADGSFCSECHRGKSPFVAGRHSIDRVGLIESCGLCHLAREH